ncbi:LOW QUALITY PROTEIN: UBN2_3 domain-containing protein, partial [Cephalotus follicularis]
VDFNDPMYLHPSDTPGANLVAEQLTDNDNYGVWSRAVLIALKGKNKIGFIDGTCAKPYQDSSLFHQWERCNTIVLSWIMNTVSKELFTGIVYSMLNSQLWDEYASMVTLPSCGCATSKAYIEHDQQQKLLQFLMGLTDSYGGIRSQLLMMNPLPIVGQAYSLISQEESHRGIIAGNSNVPNVPAVFYSNTSNYK